MWADVMLEIMPPVHNFKLRQAHIFTLLLTQKDADVWLVNSLAYLAYLYAPSSCLIGTFLGHSAKNATLHQCA